ncbi:hypothetical protein [Photorhabdus heterorhabditis]|nr:hypothetical protein [Photorhabdus heterorhabditis]
MTGVSERSQQSSNLKDEGYICNAGMISRYILLDTFVEYKEEK